MNGKPRGDMIPTNVKSKPTRNKINPTNCPYNFSGMNMSSCIGMILINLTSVTTTDL